VTKRMHTPGQIVGDLYPSLPHALCENRVQAAGVAAEGAYGYRAGQEYLRAFGDRPAVLQVIDDGPADIP
jgi:hypothetical protein